jgi:hypothetical protein
MSYARTWIAAAATGAMLLGADANAGGSDPKTILTDIYGQVNAMCSGDGNGPGYDIVAIAKRYFVPELAKKISTAAEDDTLDFDILVDGQDCKLSPLDLKVVAETGTTAAGRAEFENFGERRSIELVMAKSGDAWEVTDVVYLHRPFSLKSDF